MTVKSINFLVINRQIHLKLLLKDEANDLLVIPGAEQQQLTLEGIRAVVSSAENTESHQDQSEREESATR